MEQLIKADDGAQLWVRDVGPFADAVDSPDSAAYGRPDADAVDSPDSPADEVEVQGQPAVLCCHGGPGVADYLEPVEEALAPYYRVVRWDQRGSGRSDAVGPFTIARFVADMENVRAAVDIEGPLLLFGHSWGANLAMHYAKTYLKRPSAIAYVAGNGMQWWPEFTAVHKRRQVERLGPIDGKRLEELRSSERSTTNESDSESEPKPDKQSEAKARELRLLYIRSELHNTTDIATAELLYAKEQAFPMNLKANAGLNRQARELTLEEQVRPLRRLTCPVLVLHGASDPRPVEALTSMVEALPDVRVEVLEGAGHSPWIEQPEQLWSMVRNFAKTAFDQPD